MSAQRSRALLGWTLVALVLLASVLLPWALFDEQMSRFARELLANPSPAIVAGSVIALLASDTLLPVPSSIVATISGSALGFAGGALASSIGLCAGCWIAYALGRSLGRPGAARLVGAVELSRAEAFAGRWGAAVLVGLRAVPVLAEASAVWAGIVRMPPGRFAALTTLSNVGLAAAYAALGALAVEEDALWPGIAGAIVLPGLAMLGARVMARRLR